MVMYRMKGQLQDGTVQTWNNIAMNFIGQQQDRAKPEPTTSSKQMATIAAQIATVLQGPNRWNPRIKGRNRQLKKEVAAGETKIRWRWSSTAANTEEEEAKKTFSAALKMQK